MAQLAKRYIIQIRAILSKKGIDEETKEEMVLQATAGRTKSIRMMYTREAISLIRSLNGQEDTFQDKANQMRRKIIALCHEMGWQTEEGKIDLRRVNAYCENRGHGRKPLNDYSLKELPTLVTEFEKLHKHYLNS